MGVIQPVYFDVPADIAVATALGEYFRHGGVVRDAGGRIVAHLNEVGAPDSGGEVAQILRAIGAKPAVAALVLAGAATIATATVVVIKRRNSKRIATRLSAALAAYVEAIRDGELTPEIISGLVEVLDETKARPGWSPLAPRILPESLDVIVRLVQGYTADLARVNGVESEVPLNGPPTDFGAAVIDIRKNLESQRAIFDQAS